MRVQSWEVGFLILWGFIGVAVGVVDLIQPLA